MIKSSIKVLATLIMSLFLFSTANAGDPVKVGFVYVGPVGDHGWTYRHDIGRLAVEEAFGDDVETTYLEMVSEGPAAIDAITDLANTADGPFSQALVTGVLPNAVGFNIIMHTGLSAGSGSDKKCYAFQKNALGMAVGKDISTMVNYVPQKLATLIAAEFSGGATVIDPTAVAKFEA